MGLRSKLSRRIGKAVRRWIRQELRARDTEVRDGPQLQCHLRNLMLRHDSAARRGQVPTYTEAGLRVFSQVDEDGIILLLFSLLGEGSRVFLDIGAGDCVNGNCANLALNLGWNGLFIDGNGDNIERGKLFYAAHKDTFLYPPRFRRELINRENVNEVIEDEGFSGPIDLLSIDIDGNDYWVWDALTVVQPRVVVIETHVEFGLRSIVVPYDPDYVYPGAHPEYHGASVVAMNKLAQKKGYRLVAANRYGFNTFYVREDLGNDVLPTITPEQVLEHPRNQYRMQLFEEIKDWKYETV